MRALLDVNVWIALLDDAHVFSQRANGWIRDKNAAMRRRVAKSRVCLNWFLFRVVMTSRSKVDQGTIPIDSQPRPHHRPPY